MRATASQITGVSIVYSNVSSDADKKKTSKLRVTDLREGNSPVTGEFRTQRASNAEMLPFDDVFMTRGTQSCITKRTSFAQTLFLSIWIFLNR